MNKDRFIEFLREEGFNADYMNNNIPTVFVSDSNDIAKANKIIKKLIIENGYNESYGISLDASRKSA